MVLHLDASIDKVEDLSRDVELNRMKDMEKAVKPAEEVMEGLSPVSAVAEPSEYQYGADAFENAFPKMVQGKGMETKTPDMKAPTIPKKGKIR